MWGKKFVPEASDNNSKGLLILNKGKLKGGLHKEGEKGPEFDPIVLGPSPWAGVGR